jgi:hypothetical protein
MELVAAGVVAEIREVPLLLCLYGLLIGILVWPSHLEVVVVSQRLNQPHLEAEVVGSQRLNQPNLEAVVGCHRHNQHNRHNQCQCHRHSHNYLQQRHVGVGEEL